MFIGLRDKTLVPALPYVSAGAVMLVIAADVGCHQPLHPFIELVCLFRLYEQMKVIRHQAPGKLFTPYFPRACINTSMKAL
jgi:hypothetical protein